MVYKTPITQIGPEAGAGIIAYASVPVGKNQAFYLPGGISTRINSIRIDNPTRSFIQIKETGDLIWPLTLGWQKNLTPGYTQVTITWPPQVGSMNGGDPSEVASANLTYTDYLWSDDSGKTLLADVGAVGVNTTIVLAQPDNSYFPPAFETFSQLHLSPAMNQLRRYDISSLNKKQILDAFTVSMPLGVTDLVTVRLVQGTNYGSATPQGEIGDSNGVGAVVWAACISGDAPGSLDHDIVLCVPGFTSQLYLYAETEVDTLSLMISGRIRTE
jgi:hypothetical protein